MERTSRLHCYSTLQASAPAATCWGSGRVEGGEGEGRGQQGGEGAARVGMLPALVLAH